MDNEQEMAPDNTFVFSERWTQAEAIRLQEKIAKYSARMGIDIDFILCGLETPDRIHLLMMFFILGLEFKGMVAKPLNDFQIMEKGARKLIRALHYRSHAAKWDNDNNEYIGASHYVCIDPGLVHLQGKVKLDDNLVALWNYYLMHVSYTLCDGTGTYVPYCTCITDTDGEPTKYHWVSVRLDKSGRRLRSAIKKLFDRGYIMA